MYDELPEAPKLASFEPLSLRDVELGDVDVEPVADAGDDVPPAAIVALDSMKDGAMVALARVEREVPVVDVAPAVPLPVVPTVAL